MINIETTTKVTTRKDYELSLSEDAFYNLLKQHVSANVINNGDVIHNDDDVIYFPIKVKWTTVEEN